MSECGDYEVTAEDALEDYYAEAIRHGLIMIGEGCE